MDISGLEAEREAKEIGREFPVASQSRSPKQLRELSGLWYAISSPTVVRISPPAYVGDDCPRDL